MNETNQALLDILGIDVTTRQHINKVYIVITPDNLPKVTITQYIIVDGDSFNTTTQFELKELKEKE